MLWILLFFSWNLCIKEENMKLNLIATLSTQRIMIAHNHQAWFPLWQNIYTVGKKSSILFFVKQFPVIMWFKLWSRGEQKVQLAGRNGLRRVQLLSWQSSYFLFSLVRSWWNALSARKGQKWGMRGRVSRDDLRGDACPMVSGHNKALACSANTLTQEEYYYLLLRERHRDRISPAA